MHVRVWRDRAIHTIPVRPIEPRGGVATTAGKIHITMAEKGPPWPKQGPTSYFPSIEKKYGRSIGEWQRIIAGCGLEEHMAIVGYLKSEYGMGHGHANALVAWTLAGNVARS
jgi:hypothetical protein